MAANSDEKKAGCSAVWMVVHWAEHWAVVWGALRAVWTAVHWAEHWAEW